MDTTKIQAMETSIQSLNAAIHSLENAQADYEKILDFYPHEKTKAGIRERYISQITWVRDELVLEVDYLKGLVR